ncbi:hypothetical protein B6U71_05090 [Euryarchaeota archaeon ex4484_178]|nr:MAG: hypothetical protein B6U71_05090 [Euryarchaeota archaeon ex4484_178]
MELENLFDSIEESLLDLLARVDEGDEEALEELKKFRRYIVDLAEVLSIIEDEDKVEDFKKKLDILSKKFDEFLMDIVHVVG